MTGLYRASVGIVLFNHQGFVFAGMRADKSFDSWQMPQGGIEEGESIEAAALRELQEETGTDQADIIAISKEWFSYDFPDSLQKKLWGGKYQGQRQKWVAAYFKAEDKDICLNATSHPEFKSWKWVALEDIPLLAVSFKKPVYQKVVAEFCEIINQYLKER